MCVFAVSFCENFFNSNRSQAGVSLAVMRWAVFIKEMLAKLEKEMNFFLHGFVMQLICYVLIVTVD